MSSAPILKQKWLLLLIGVVIIVSVSYLALQPHSVQENPNIIRIGVLPDQTPENLQRRYDPLLAYLSKETGLNYELVIPDNYGALLTLFGMQKVDIAYFGGFTFIKAREFYNAEPLVMREVDTRFTSLFLTQLAHPGKTFEDFKGQVLAFGSQLSTSGHLMPRYFMQTEKQIEPEAFFGHITYSGSHEKTANLVQASEVELGVANAEIIKQMLSDGRLKQDAVRILWETPPYADYVWASRKDISSQIKSKIQNAFLSLSTENPEQAKVLKGLSAALFLPARNTDFIAIYEIASKLDMLNQSGK